MTGVLHPKLAPATQLTGTSTSQIDLHRQPIPEAFNLPPAVSTRITGILHPQQTCTDDPYHNRCISQTNLYLPPVSQVLYILPALAAHSATPPKWQPILRAFDIPNWSALTTDDPYHRCFTSHVHHPVLICTDALS